MIRAEFYESDGLMSGFTFSGHAGYAESGSDVVCAAVSSAVQLTANLLEDFDFSPDVNVGNTGDCHDRANTGFGYFYLL